MSWLSLLSQIYTLDTLDTRFSATSKAPPRDAIELRYDATRTSIPPTDEQHSDGVFKTQKPTQDARPSKWNTPEYYFYFLVIIVAVPMMFKSVVDVSKPSHPNYKDFENRLSEGWFLGRKVDNSDGQYASFRGNIPYLFVLVFVHPLLRKAWHAISNIGTSTRAPTAQGGLTHGLSPSAAADARFEHRISFDVIFSAILIVALHGLSSLKIVLILFANYQLARSLPRKHVPAATWIFNIATLFANESFRGYSYAKVLGSIDPAAAINGASFLRGIGTQLDSFAGLVPRWEVLFNITVLRLISFNMDYYWSHDDLKSGSAVEKKQLDVANLSERDRVKVSAKPLDYSFRNYFAYALYAPLYLAGPILTFNDYISQCRYKSPSITQRRTIMYGIRFVVVLLTMEVMIHYMYMVAIFDVRPDWSAYTPMQLSMLGYFNLNHIWLKLLIPWRFFRFWSLMDGIDPPENMVRCMSDNYSALAFWRGWHRSFNQWIIRYIFIPLGGSRSPGNWGKARSIANFLAVFTFVALWHDIQLRLLMWGWLITLFVLPEVIATMAFPANAWRKQPNTYRWLCGIGATLNILMMMAANLVGFAIGVDGLVELTKSIFKTWDGVAFLAGAMGALFVGSQVMFEVRESEQRKGIKLKC